MKNSQRLQLDISDLVDELLDKIIEITEEAEVDTFNTSVAGSDYKMSIEFTKEKNDNLSDLSQELFKHLSDEK